MNTPVFLHAGAPAAGQYRSTPHGTHFVPATPFTFTSARCPHLQVHLPGAPAPVAFAPAAASNLLRADAPHHDIKGTLFAVLDAPQYPHPLVLVLEARGRHCACLVVELFLPTTPGDANNPPTRTRLRKNSTLATLAGKKSKSQSKPGEVHVQEDHERAFQNAVTPTASMLYMYLAQHPLPKEKNDLLVAAIRAYGEHTKQVMPAAFPARVLDLDIVVPRTPLGDILIRHFTVGTSGDRITTPHDLLLATYYAAPKELHDFTEAIKNLATLWLEVYRDELDALLPKEMVSIVLNFQGESSVSGEGSSDPSQYPKRLEFIWRNQNLEGQAEIAVDQDLREPQVMDMMKWENFNALIKLERMRREGEASSSST